MICKSRPAVQAYALSLPKKLSATTNGQAAACPRLSGWPRLARRRGSAASASLRTIRSSVAISNTLHGGGKVVAGHDGRDARQRHSRHDRPAARPLTGANSCRLMTTAKRFRRRIDELPVIDIHSL